MPRPSRPSRLPRSARRRMRPSGSTNTAWNAVVIRAVAGSNPVSRPQKDVQRPFPGAPVRPESTLVTAPSASEHDPILKQRTPLWGTRTHERGLMVRLMKRLRRSLALAAALATLALPSVAGASTGIGHTRLNGTYAALGGTTKYGRVVHRLWIVSTGRGFVNYDATVACSTRDGRISRRATRAAWR